MKLLLTNDDGIEAPGLAALAGALDGSAELTIVAPHTHLSGCSHQVNSHRPLQVTAAGDGRHAVDGTPADCTRLGLLYLAPETEWVFSGINDGGNLGVDVYMSGTVAAVREAALLGRPGIALSQYRSDGADPTWDETVRLVEKVLPVLLEKRLEPGAFWNVNFPDPTDCRSDPEIVFCPLEAGHLPVHYELRDGRYHYKGNYRQRPRTPGSDVDVCFSGAIAVTQVLPPPSV